MPTDLCLDEGTILFPHPFPTTPPPQKKKEKEENMQAS